MIAQQSPFVARSKYGHQVVRKSPAASTRTFTGNAISGGFLGDWSTTTQADSINFSTNDGGWAGYVIGTAATLVAYQSQLAVPNGMLQASVDGADYTVCPVVNGAYVLMAGASDGVHFLRFRGDTAYGNATAVKKTAVALSVTGSSPALILPSVRMYADDPQTATFASNRASFAANGDTTMPHVHSTAQGIYGYGASCVRFRANASYLIVATSGVSVLVQRNQEAPIEVLTPDQLFYQPRWQIVRIPVTPGDADYIVWQSKAAANFAILSVACDAPSLVPLTGILGRMDQYGDSISNGAGGTFEVTGGPGGFGAAGRVELYQVANQMGYLPGLSGVDGNRTSDLVARLPTVLAGRLTDVTKDVAILAIGRNDNGPFNSTQIADYNTTLDLLLAKYKTVLCRGVLREAVGTGQGSYLDQTNSIAAIVAARASSRVKFIDVSGWPIEETVDGTHPSNNGYRTLVPYCVAAYTAALA